jgi:nitrate/nitrite transporter NarK
MSDFDRLVSLQESERLNFTYFVSFISFISFLVSFGDYLLELADEVSFD